MGLTRADLESSRFSQLIQERGLSPHVLSEAELQASIAATLQQHPPDADVWIFAYGSLIWNPIFRFVDRRIGTIYGWHRQFCMWTPIGRGTPENPGLVLGLERGGSCQGFAYRIAAADVASELLLIWRREMIVGSYIPRWVRVRGLGGVEEVEAIAFVINRHHRAYTGKLPPAVIVEHIATASGMLGSCADYLMQTIEGLTAAGIRDQYLTRLRDRVIVVQQSRGLPEAEQPQPALSKAEQPEAGQPEVPIAASASDPLPSIYSPEEADRLSSTLAVAQDLVIPAPGSDEQDAKTPPQRHDQIR
jgi:glutathione-specific gamma-glutamylcyclotransferase